MTNKVCVANIYHNKNVEDKSKYHIRFAMSNIFQKNFTMNNYKKQHILNTFYEVLLNPTLNENNKIK